MTYKLLKKSGCKSWKEYNQKQKLNKPEVIPNRLGVFQINEVLPYIGKHSPDKEYMGEMVKMNSTRYRLFNQKGTVCVCCGMVGTHFILERHNQNEKYHLNLYGTNILGEEIPLTRDHILPKSKGGPSNISNYQTMCKKCNSTKADTIIDYFPPEDTMIGVLKRFLGLFLNIPVFN